MDPPPNVDSVAGGGMLGIGLSLAGGVPGDSIRLTLHDGRGSLEDSAGLGERLRGTLSGGSGTPGCPWANPGTWEVAIEVNDETIVTYPIRVVQAE